MESRVLTPEQNEQRQIALLTRLIKSGRILCNLEEVARMLRITDRELIALNKKMDGPVSFKLGKHFMYFMQDVEDFIKGKRDEAVLKLAKHITKQKRNKLKKEKELDKRGETNNE